MFTEYLNANTNMFMKIDHPYTRLGTINIHDFILEKYKQIRFTLLDKITIYHGSHSHGKSWKMAQNIGMEIENILKKACNFSTACYEKFQ